MKKITGIKKIILCLLVFCGIFIAVTAIAADGSELLIAWPPSPITGENINADTELHNLIIYIYEWGVALGGMAIFIVLIIAGVQYLTSTGKPEIMREAQGRIRSGIIGLILLLSMWLILHTISPRLVQIEPLDLDLLDMVSCDIDGGDASCQERFGEYFKCVDGYCTLDIEDFRDSLMPTACERVDVSSKWFGALSSFTEPLPPGHRIRSLVNYIEENEPISLTPVLPEIDGEEAKTCMASITMYEGGFFSGCTGKSTSQVIIVSEDKGPEEIIIERHPRIKCIRNEKIQTPWD